MALNYVTLTLDLYDGQGSAIVAGTATLTPSVQLTDTTDHEWIPPAPLTVTFRPGTAPPSVKLLATDNGAPLPAGWGWIISFSGVPGNPAGFTFFLPFSSGASQFLSAQAPVSGVVTQAASAIPGIYVAPSGDTTGAADQAAITAAEALGKTVYFGPGTFWVTGLVKQAATIWQGSGRNSTTIKLASGANADVAQGANFGTLTLSGSATGGIGGFEIADMTLDGNKAGQSGTSYGLRIFGYDFSLRNVTIRNCLSWGLYTEWGGNTTGPGPDLTEEAHYYGVKIYGCGQGGWRDRGPHDSRSYDVTISNNGAGFPAYWSEVCALSNNATVAAGSNGADLSTFTSGSPGTLNVTTTLGFPAASLSATQGTITVPTAHTPVTLTYTGTTATSFTGCVAQGSPAGGSTVSTGASVTPPGPSGRCYGTNGTLHEGMHCYGSATSWQYQVDGQVDLVDCIGEVAATGMVLVRVWECGIVGGHYFVLSGAPQTGLGIQIGDAVNAVSHLRADTYISNLAGTSAATAALNIVNDNGSSAVDALVFQPSGTAIFGTASHASRYRVASAGQSSAASAGISFEQIAGPLQRWLPTQGQGWTLSLAGGADQVNFNTTSSRWEFLNGLLARWYAGNYVNPTVEVDGAAGTVGLGPAGGGGVDTKLSRTAAKVFQSNGALSSAGLTGAVAASRYAGATAAGAPGSGTFAAGDFVVDQSGAEWVCTAGGTPGTWVPLQSGTWLPSDNNLLAASADVNGLGGTGLMVAGTLYLVAVRIRYAITASKIWFIESPAGSGASTGSFAGLYSSAGTLLSGSADAAAAYTGGFAQSVSLTTPQALAAGIFVWAALLVNLATTQPTMRLTGGGSAVPGSVNLPNSQLRVCVNGTGLTSLPASVTPASNTGAGAFPHWIGIS